MAAPVAEEPAKRPRKVSNVPYKKITRRSAQGLQSKKESDRRRGQTRITIGIAFPRWRALKKEKGLRADTDVALLLLDSYERYTKGLFASTSVKAKGKNQSQPPSSVSTSSTRSKRYEARSSISLTITGTCIQEPNTHQHVSPCEKGKQQQQDDVEHQSETTQTSSDCLQNSFEEMEVTIDEDECSSVKNRLSDLDSELENVEGTTELSAPEADDSCDEDVYVPIFPQRSKASELLLECEEEELQPWQKETSHVHFKVEDDDGELGNDQTDFKPDPSLLQINAKSSSPPTVKTETPQPAVFNSQGFLVVSPQLTSNTEFISSLRTQCCAGNSFTIVPAAQQQLFQTATPIIKSEACDILQTSDVHQVSNNAVSLSSVQSPAVYATSFNQQQSNPHSLAVPFPLPCFTILELNKPASQTNSNLVNQDDKL